MSNDKGYINYFEILGLDENAKRGEVVQNYKHATKGLRLDIRLDEITEERRAFYVLEMAKLNAAFFILRDNKARETYWETRRQLIAMEQQWRDAVVRNAPEADTLRRAYDGKLRHFLSKYVEETMLQAGRDRDCIKESNWDEAHERYASRVLRHYRQSLYQQILERLPYTEVTPPQIDWEERSRTIAAILAEGDR